MAIKAAWLLVVALVVGVVVASNWTDMQRLEKFYDSTKGKQWYNSDNWRNESVSICDWYGVTCNDDGATVKDLKLENNNLQNGIPDDDNIWEGWGIHTLNLNSNFPHYSDYHPIPNSLALAENLTHIILEHCNLYPGIPTNFGNLKNLVKLDLLASFANYYYGDYKDLIPTELGNLQKLTYLDLSGNTYVFYTIPPELGNAKNLQYYKSADSGLVGVLPDTFGSLTNFQYLNVHDSNMVGTIPASYSNLESLTFLDLTINNFDGLIDPVAKLPNLNTLALGENLFFGKIPSFEYLTNLTFLALYGNKFVGSLPASLSNIATLENVYIQDLGLGGELPDLSKAKNLQRLIASNNYLRGDLGDWICNVEQVALKNSEFNCPLPSCCDDEKGQSRAERCGHIPCIINVD